MHKKITKTPYTTRLGLYLTNRCGALVCDELGFNLKHSSNLPRFYASVFWGGKKKMGWQFSKMLWPFNKLWGRATK